MRRDTGRQERCHGEQTLKAVIPAKISNPAADPRHSLVVTYPSEKYEFVSWDHYSQYIEKYSKKCSKPPTSSPISGPNHFGVCARTATYAESFVCGSLFERVENFLARPEVQDRRNPLSTRALVCLKVDPNYCC